MDKDTAWCVSVRKLQDWCPITELHTFYTNTFYIYWTLYGDVSSYQLCLLICFVFLQSRNHIPEQIPMIFLLRGMCKWGNLSLKKKRGGEREMKTVKANWQQRSASACYKHKCKMERWKKSGVFLPVCIQSKCSMSRGGYYAPKEKHSPDDENMIGRPGQPSLTFAPLSQ